MKRTLLILFIITGVCFGQTYDHIEFYGDGISPKVIRTYKQSRNKLNDLVLETRWYENGQKQLEITAKDGILDGKITKWHENGQKSIEGTYKEGKYDGKLTQWYENGQKSIEGTYKDGKVNGKWTRWADDGSLTIQLTLQDGKMSDSEINAFKSLFIINGKFRCFDGSKSVTASWVNDNECDCNDCSDEPLMKR